MKFPRPLLEGKLLRRYQRFLAEVTTPRGMVTAHCPNTGSMLGCAEPGSRVWLSPAENPARRLAWTWEIVEADGILVGIHTGRSNALVREAIGEGVIRELQGYREIQPEVGFGLERSRADFLLSGGRRKPCYVEVKNVTAAVSGGVALFPDAVSSRGTRHLREMMHAVQTGCRAVLVFCAQRGDVNEVRPADAIDPEYGATLRQALDAGVEAIAYRAEVSPGAIVLTRKVPVVIPARRG
jgi:sugar fermentation stimulation protein A